MADQKINALPSKTAPTTGDKMLMVGTAEEYLIDYDKLATAILNKLSSQSFSSLDTTAKTVLGAVNELNSKIKYKNDPSVNDLLKAGVICYGLLHRDSSPEIEYELTYASFYISISDSWAVTIITFPYAYNMNNQKFHIGTYDVSKKKWTWTQN